MCVSDVYATLVQVPKEARRGHPIPWSWSYQKCELCWSLLGSLELQADSPAYPFHLLLNSGLLSCKNSFSFQLSNLLSSLGVLCVAVLLLFLKFSSLGVALK